MRHTVLATLTLAVAACSGDSVASDLGSLAGYWEGTATEERRDANGNVVGFDTTAVEVVIQSPGEGSSLLGCASFRFPWMGEDSRETIDILGTVAGDAVTLYEAPSNATWDFQGERVASDTLRGTSDPEHHQLVDLTLARTSTGGTCGVRALP